MQPRYVVLERRGDGARFEPEVAESLRAPGKITGRYVPFPASQKAKLLGFVEALLRSTQRLGLRNVWGGRCLERVGQRRCYRVFTEEAACEPALSKIRRDPQTNKGGARFLPSDVFI